MVTQTTTATVLVVDDDALITIGTVDMVQDLGFCALEAYSAKEALQVLADNPGIGVMITDYAMPDMTGVQLAAQAIALRPNLHVALATGYSELPNGETCDLPRLDKPFREDDLAAFLHSTMAGA